MLLTASLAAPAQADGFAHSFVTGATAGQALTIYNPYIGTNTTLGPTIDNHQINGVDVFCTDPFMNSSDYYTIGDTRNFLSADLKTAAAYAAMFSEGKPYVGGLYNPYGYNLEIVRKMGVQMAVFDASALSTVSPGWALTMFGESSVYYQAMLQAEAECADYSELPLKSEVKLEIPSFASKAKGTATPVQLSYNAAAKTYEATVSDSNSVLPDYNFSALMDGITYTSSGNTLSISVPAGIVRTLFTGSYGNELRYDTEGVTARKTIKCLDYTIFSPVSGAYQCMVQAKTENMDIKETAYLSFSLTEEDNSSITVEKSSDTGEVSGFEFDITGPISFTLVTDKNGLATKQGIPAGTYTVTEKTYSGYTATAPQTQTISEGQTAVFSFANTAKRLNISVNKSDSATKTSVQGDACVDGSVFGLYKSKDDSLFGQYTVSNGKIAIDNVPLTEMYYLKEISPAAGYGLNQQKYPVTIDPAAVISTAKFTIDIENDIECGSFTIVKKDSETGICLRNAEFRIINRSSSEIIFNDIKYQTGEAVQTVTTDATGKAVSGRLPYGTYEIEEITPPTGWKISDASVTLANYDSDGKVLADTEVVVYDDPHVITGKIRVIKTDADTGTAGQGDVNINGAVYGLYNSADDTELCRIDVNAPEYTEVPGLNPSLKYYLKEISAPEGYELDEKKYEVSFASEETVPVSVRVKDTVQKGHITIIKEDAGSAEKLRGAVFDVINRSVNAVVFGGKTYQPGETVQTLITGEDGTAVSGELPYGTYEVKETKAPAGWSLGAESSRTVSIYEAGTVTENTPLTFQDYSSRGDIAFQKKDQQQRFLPYVVFEVTADSTGERHYIVTDGNGEFNSGAPRYLHSKDTNANDKAVRENGSIDETLINPKAGVWFSGPGNVAVNDNVGAFPNDTYHFRELESSANEGMILLSFDVEVSVADYTTDLGTLTDLTPPAIQSVFLDDTTKTHKAEADLYTTLVETVSLHDVAGGQSYTIQCEIVDAATGQVAADNNGNELRQTKTIVPAASEVENIQFKFTFDATNMRGKTLIATDRLLYDFQGEQHEIAVHSPDTFTNDELEMQTVFFPDIGTMLTDSNGSKLVQAGVVTLNDTVCYSQLDTGRQYRLKGELYEAETGNPVLNGNGTVVTAEKVFTPPTATGSVEVLFRDVDLSNYAGKSVVCFETLMLTGSGTAIAEHRDPDDPAQTVRVLSLHTEATNRGGKKNIAPAADQIIVDTVSYKGLEADTEYSLKGTLYDRDSGMPLGITAERTFVADASGEGSVSVEFVFDATDYGGMKIVAAEELIKDSVTIGQHRELNDDSQTVYVAGKLQTTAVSDTGGKTVTAGENTGITDVVEFSNLIPNENYLLVGTLVNGEGEPIVIDGEPLVSQLEFSPQDSNGNVRMLFSFDVSKVHAGKIVCFEELYDAGGVLVSEHKDLSDENQTVSRKAKISTSLKFANGSKVFSEFETPEQTVSIIDTVTYEGFVPGVYVFSGTLMEKASGKALVDDEGKPLTALREVEITEENGSVDIPFETQARYLDGLKVVAFERVMSGDTVIAAHEDLGDEEQTVLIYKYAEIFKYDATTGFGVKGAVIRVTDTETSVSFEKETDEDGKLTFMAVPGHSYTFQEKQAPEGYVLNEALMEFSVTEEGEIIGDTEMANMAIGTATIIKRDAISGLPVAGAEITVYDSNDKPVYVAQTDKDGMIYFKASSAGTYKFQETRAPDGYYLNSDIYTFTVGADMTAAGQLEFADAPLGTIVIKKTSANGTKLPGATIAFYYSDGTLFGKGITDYDGKVYFVSPGQGTYYFKEEKAPDGYVLNSKTFTVTINENYAISGTTTITNEPLTTTPQVPQTADYSNFPFWTVSLAAGTLLTLTAAFTLLIRKRRIKGGHSERME